LNLEDSRSLNCEETMAEQRRNPEWRVVVERYPSPCRPGGVEYLGGAGGFSGARFWRLTTPYGRLCLRRWPEEHPSPSHLAQIHRVLQHVFLSGCQLVPVPLKTSDGHTFVEHNRRLWELTPWLPGNANFLQRPTRDKLVGAAQALARFHQAAETSLGPAGSDRPSPAVGQRHEQLLQLQRGGAPSIRGHVPSRCWPGLSARAVVILDFFDGLAPQIVAMLDDARRSAVRLQPCIRDIWHDHVLFQGNEVSGLVDFGAMQIDSVAGDIARLFGSIVGDDPRGWETAQHAYESIRPLSDNERSLIPVLDRSAVLLSGMNWLLWICEEQREFEGQNVILSRLDVTIQRLRRLTEEGG